jgi:multiple sugar transport system ATP-binding protein
VVEPLGTEAVLYGDVGDRDVTALVGRFHDLAKGDTVPLTIAPEHVYVFETETEALLKGRLTDERAESEAPGGVEA